MSSKQSTQKSSHQLACKVSPHLLRLAKTSSVVKKQFFDSKNSPVTGKFESPDPLEEERFVKTKGLIHKYTDRVLIELTMACAAYCRFCTRQRKVSEIASHQLTTGDIDAMVDYVTNHTQIREIIFSGGDPLMAPDFLAYAIEQFNSLSQITVIRIHTRVPVSAPSLVSNKIEQVLKSVTKTLYVSIHFEHADELCPETVAVVKRLRALGAVLLSQTVFLKDINDEVETLKTLFNRLVELGVRPYYIHRCDPVRGAERFQVSFEKELEIMTQLRRELSGIAYPTYVIDAPFGVGKIPPPLLFWDFDHDYCFDFNHKKISF